ncbi:alpha/beta hydrolase [Clostridium amazonitimonense]|uniref:alpha/beta hydrolase n=1 Tax=Clostridium amazonitimonense TaxID=1499689 RepID=UPI000509B683|nr:alpha/beta hydrolase [Clostridium amazonitimonense]
MKKKSVSILLILLIFLSTSIILLYEMVISNKSIAENKNIETNSEISITHIGKGEQYLDLMYKPLGNDGLKLDFYAPLKSEKETWPVIVYIHGGSWAYGNKGFSENLMPLINKLREEGYALVSIEYRLASEEIVFPSPVEDCKDALRWLYKNKDKYNIDTNNIGLLGVSSGGHLALLTAYSNEDDFIGDNELSSYKSKVKYVIDYSGPTNFDIEKVKTSEENSINIVKNFLGKDNLFNENILKAASATNYINRDSPPTLIIHGENDTLVPISQSIELYERGKKEGMDIKLLKIPNGDHMLSNITYLDIIKIAKETLSFVESKQ